MLEVLPLLQQLIPACGITVFNVRSLTYTWWLTYVRTTRAMLDNRRNHV